MALNGDGMTATPAVCPQTLGLGAIREGFAKLLESAQFQSNPLRVNPWFADSWTPPCAFIGATEVLFKDDAYGGLTSVTVQVRLVVPAQALRPAQLSLEEILDSYYGALQADTTIGGLVKRVIAVEARPVLVQHGTQDLPAYD